MGLPVLDDSIHNYLVEINRFPLLSKDEEYALALRWHEKKDVPAAHTLVTSNLRFVVKIALEYRNYGCHLKDLIQEGNLGLMTAVKKFNPYKGCRLITYAAWWIRSFIQEYILRTKGLVKRPAKALKKRLFYRNRPAGNLPLKLNDLPLEEGYDGIGVNTIDVNANDLSLDSPAGGDDEKTRRIEKLTSPAPTQEELLNEKEERAIVKRGVTNALTLLSEKERLVIEKRIMADEPASLQVVGERLGLTRERVRQIENSALKKLKASILKEPFR